MKNDEFLNISKILYDGQEIVIRYFTYNIDNYMDIVGKLITIQENNWANDYYIKLKYIDNIIPYNSSAIRSNIPLYQNNGELYCMLLTSKMIFIIESLNYYRHIKTKILKERICDGMG